MGRSDGARGELRSEGLQRLAHEIPRLQPRVRRQSHRHQDRGAEARLLLRRLERSRTSEGHLRGTAAHQLGRGVQLLDA